MRYLEEEKVKSMAIYLLSNFVWIPKSKILNFPDELVDSFVLYASLKVNRLKGEED